MHAAMESGNIYLASLIAQSGGGELGDNSEWNNSDFRNDMVAQVRLWKQPNNAKQPKTAWQFFSEENKHIYSILSGAVEVARYFFLCVRVVRIFFLLFNVFRLRVCAAVRVCGQVNKKKKKPRHC